MTNIISVNLGKSYVPDMAHPCRTNPEKLLSTSKNAVTYRIDSKNSTHNA